MVYGQLEDACPLVKILLFWVEANSHCSGSAFLGRKMERGQVAAPSVSRKGKKKKAKDESDRLKQAEKKKRRLEKALATSAAIRSELEKKKQKKKEEQQRLDEEGAAIAESVALHVLGGEDSDDVNHFMLNSDRRLDFFSEPRSTDLCMDRWGLNKFPFDRLRWVSNVYEPQLDWGCRTGGWPMPPCAHRGSLQGRYIEEMGQLSDLSPGILAAQAVSALHIAEDSDGDRTAGLVVDRMIPSNYIHSKVKFYEEY